jgi:protein-disulfide isomerase
VSGKKDRERRRDERLHAEADVASGERRRKLLQIASALGFLVVAGVLVLIVVEAGKSNGGDAGNVVETGAVDELLTGIPQSGMTLGNPMAKAKLVEFGDLKCPVCKAFSEEVIPGVIESKVRGGAAALEFRNFTIIDEESTPAGAAALAAGEQGRGWNFVELFYRNQGLETSHYVTDEFLTAIAKKAGVPDISRWNRERKSNRILKEVSRTTAEADRLGFEGTPSFAVEGPGTSGLSPLGTVEGAELEEAIESAGG